MKTNPFVLAALLCVAAMVTGESAVVFRRMDRATASWRSELRVSAARVGPGQITTGLVRVLVRAAQ